MRRLLAILSCVVLLTACSGADGPSGPIDGGIEGTYILRTIDGSPMPYRIQQNGSFMIDLVDDTYTFTLNGEWSEVLHIRTTNNGTAITETITDAGSYSRNGARITLVSSATGAYAGSEVAGTLTFDDAGLTSIYTK